MTATVQEILQEFRAGLERIYGSPAGWGVLFGSQARGDAEPDSDIDVMVVLKGEVHPGREIERVSPLSGELSLQRDVVISCVYVSEEDYRQEDSPLMLNVRREGLAL